VKLILIVPFLGITFLLPIAAQNTGTRPAQTTGQTAQLTPTQKEAILELNEAALSYRNGNFAEAQQHSEKALALDPTSKNALVFIARTIHAQYKLGDRSEANIAKARDAIDSYKRILVQEPHSEEAYKAIAYLYAVLKEDEQLRQWVLQRAVDATFSNDKRAEAFVVLASRDWDCSFRITELPANKTTIAEGAGVKLQFTRPKDAAEFEKARQCAANGLVMSESAIALAPDSESAWAYKTSLLSELSKLSEMDNNLQLKAEYERQGDAARSILFEAKRAKRPQNLDSVTTPP
jgi:tetratricopeptide (TPR) repeat protein